MTLVAALAGSARHQARNLARFGLGRPLAPPSFAAATLDEDDVAVARDWLDRPGAWDDTALVTEYERAFAEWNGSAAAFAFMSGRESLSACIAALGLEPGDEIVLPGYTCVVVPNALRYAGVVPVYADIELDTYGADAADVARRITTRTKALLIQHLYGLVCRDYDALVDLARERGLALIEDCAHATGATYRGRRVGTRGTLAFYSSERSKVFCTITGGLAVTNDVDLAARLREIQSRQPVPSARRIRSQLHSVELAYYQHRHPQRWWRADWARLKWGRYEIRSTRPEELTGVRPADYGCRMAAPIAALGMTQLRKIDACNARRREAARRWDVACAERGFATPRVLPDSTPVYLRYPVLVEPARKHDRSWGERTFGVPVGRWFETHLHPAPGLVEGCPQADEAVARCINLPTLMA
jgi:perosamine synthetase